MIEEEFEKEEEMFDSKLSGENILERKSKPLMLIWWMLFPSNKYFEPISTIILDGRLHTDILILTFFQNLYILEKEKEKENQKLMKIIMV